MAGTFPEQSGASPIMMWRCRWLPSSGRLTDEEGSAPANLGQAGNGYVVATPSHLPGLIHAPAESQGQYLVPGARCRRLAVPCVGCGEMWKVLPGRF